MNQRFDEYNPDHYITPRRDMLPGVLHTDDDKPLRLSPLAWGAIAAAFSFAVAMLALTDCGAAWCS